VVLALALTPGLINVLDNPGRQAFVRELVPGDLVGNAITLNSVLVNVARAVGAAVAGVMIATVGVEPCFLINAVSLVAVIFVFVTMDAARLHPAEPVRRGPGQLRPGLLCVRSTPELLVPLLMMMALVGTLTHELQVVLPAPASG
jgi:MFS family permease